MRPPRKETQKGIPILLIALAFLMVFSWTVVLASAQDETPKKVLKKGTTHTANKLIVQKYELRSVYLSGTVYRLTGSTDILDASGQRISKKSVPVGSLVNIVYVTDKDTTEAYPFNVKDKVLLKMQVVAAASK